jgi:hypothetical protein
LGKINLHVKKRSHNPLTKPFNLHIGGSAAAARPAPANALPWGQWHDCLPHWSVKESPTYYRALIFARVKRIDYKSKKESHHRQTSSAAFRMIHFGPMISICRQCAQEVKISVILKSPGKG